MSEIRIRVGSEDVHLCGPGDRPLPVALVEREIENSRLRQSGGEPDRLPWRIHRCAHAGAGRACGILRLFPGPKPVGESEWVVEDTNRDECAHGMDLRDAEHVVALHNTVIASASDEADKNLGDLRMALRDAPIVGGVAPAWVIRLHRAACAVAEIEVRESDPQATTVAATQIAGKFVERKPSRPVDAIQWTDGNTSDVEAWLSGRVESAKVDPDDGGVMMIWDDGARMRCRRGDWIVQDGFGEIRTMNSDWFERIYAREGDRSPPSSRTYSRDALLRMTDDALEAHGRMVRGLARVAAAYEAGEGGATLDDEMRSALALARELKIAPPPSPRFSSGGEHVESDMSKAGRLFAEAWNKKARPTPGIDEVVVDACARVAYDVYRVAFVGDDPMPEFDALDLERRAHVLRATRAAVSGTTPESFHAEWTSELARDGWTAGPELSEDAKTHPNLVPYGDLSDEQHLLDALFFVAATATLRELGRIEASRP